MLLSATNLLKQAWEIYKKKFWVFFGIAVIPLFAPSIIVSILFPLKIRIENFELESINILSAGLLVFVAILALVSVFIYLWSQTAMICAVKDKSEDVGAIEYYKQGWSKLASYIWVYFLSNAIIGAGFLFFFIPGLIFLVWFIFSPFILIAENKKGWEALMANKDYVQGNWLGVFWRFLAFWILSWIILWAVSIIVNIIGVGNTGRINLYISYLLLNPLGIIYLYLIYDNLKKIKNGKNSDEKIPKKN